MSAFYEQGAFIIAADDDGSANDDGIVVSDKSFGNIELPDNLNGTKFTIEAKVVKTSEWRPLIYIDGSPVEISLHAGNNVQPLPPEVFGCDRIRLVSDDTQSAERQINYHVQQR